MALAQAGARWTERGGDTMPSSDQAETLQEVRALHLLLWFSSTGRPLPGTHTHYPSRVHWPDPTSLCSVFPFA